MVANRFIWYEVDMSSWRMTEWDILDGGRAVPDEERAFSCVLCDPDLFAFPACGDSRRCVAPAVLTLPQGHHRPQIVRLHDGRALRRNSAGASGPLRDGPSCWWENRHILSLQAQPRSGGPAPPFVAGCVPVGAALRKP